MPGEGGGGPEIRFTMTDAEDGVGVGRLIFPSKAAGISAGGREPSVRSDERAPETDDDLRPENPAAPTEATPASGLSWSDWSTPALLTAKADHMSGVVRCGLAVCVELAYADCW